MTKTMLIRGATLGAIAVALSGCYSGYEAPPPAPAYGYDNGYGAYYYGPSASFGFYGSGDDWHHHDEDGWDHGDDD